MALDPAFHPVMRRKVSWLPTTKHFDMYLETVSELAERAGLLAHAEFEFLYKRAQIARQLFLETRQRLNQHTAEHGC